MQIISYLCTNFQEMETSCQTNSIAITQLKKAVEVRFGHIPATPADFGELSIAVLRVTGECVSPDTLSRIWGYKDTFSCRTIAQGEVLIVDHVETANGTYEGYRMGDKNGLTLVERLNDGGMSNW